MAAHNSDVVAQPGRAAAVLGAVYAALAVALAAYAAHGASGKAAEWLQQASHFLLLHAVVFVALLGRRGRLLGWACRGLLLGVTLFSGSLIGAALIGLPTTLAPFGGTLMIVSWLLLAIALWRGEGGR